MNPSFDIQVLDWIGHGDGDSMETAIEAATFASLMIVANDRHVLTLVNDTVNKDFRSSVRVSAFVLASWFAENWWRLRWEVERPGIDWRLCHKMSAAGNGYVWPDVSFASDGQGIVIRSKETKVREDPIRYIANFDTYVSGEDFEAAVDGFIAAVIDRVQQKSVASSADAKDLIDLWHEIGDERNDPELAAWRRMEAMWGYNPDEAPEDILETLFEMRTSHGAAAIDEMLAAADDIPPGDLGRFWEESRAKSFGIQIPMINEIREQMRQANIHQSARPMAPWQRATKTAAIVRQVWGLGNGPLPMSELQERLGMSTSDFDSVSGYQDSDSFAGFRNGADTDLSVFIHRPLPTARRFDLARLIGDHIDTGEQAERVLPSTYTKTARQQFQRAFAQEFLCPSDTIKERFDTDQGGRRISENDVRRAADDFGVSGYTIMNILGDEGLVSRDTFPVS